MTDNTAEPSIDLSELYAHGIDVFGDVAKFGQWLDSPIYALGWRKPADFLDTATGRQELNWILYRIEHFIFS
jgi:uncharacterized protein (DUF2384 family)